MCVLATARPTLWRDDPARFAGRDHVRIELRPLVAQARCARSRAAILGERAAGERGEALADRSRSRRPGSPLFAEELARLAAARAATPRARRRSRRRCRCTSTRSTTTGATPRRSSPSSGSSGLGRRARGARRRERGRGAARRSPRPRSSSSRRTSRFAGTREWAFKHALMREVAYASLGEDALQELPRARRTLARARWARTTRPSRATSSSAARRLRPRTTSRRRRGARSRRTRSPRPCRWPRRRSPSPRTSRRSSRARSSSTRRGTASTRAPASATRRSARCEDAVYDEASEVRARGARVRYEDACGGGRRDERAPRRGAPRGAGRGAPRRRGAMRGGARGALRLRGRARQGGRGRRLASSTLSQQHGIAGAAVDAWQTLAVVRQARGDVGAALEARRSAARAASAAGLKTREATLTINVGFALTTMGAKGEARLAIESGIALAQAIGSPGRRAPRPDEPPLLGGDVRQRRRRSIALLAEPRAIADAALAGSWVPHDRATLGVLFYRGMELLRARTRRRDRRAHPPASIAAQGYRATKMLDVAAGRARPLGRGRAALRQAERRPASSRARRRSLLERRLAEPAQRGARLPRAPRRVRRSRASSSRRAGRDRARRSRASSRASRASPGRRTRASSSRSSRRTPASSPPPRPTASCPTR